ncbi:MAG: PhnD/SsuA/transferrin family substrate-binding protein [Ilumatobacteraceae bacterium]
MAGVIDDARAEFGMYPFASVRRAWDALWAAVHERAPWTPDRLTWSGDVHAAWADGDVVVTHICGGPFAGVHHRDMTLIGAFSLDLPDAEPPAHYRTVLLSPHDVPLDRLIGPDVRAVASSTDSLSGWSSLLAATVGPGAGWPGPVTFTGAHYGSVRALAVGDGDLASIDAWSLAFIATEEPELLTSLYRVGTGPRIPTPAVTARASVDQTLAGELRTAFRGALASDELTAVRTALHIAGFEHVHLDDYLAIRPLSPTA